MEMIQSESTAARRRVPLHLVDATDGITPETGEAGGQPQVSKNGAAFANTSATLLHVGNGLYTVELTTGELDTLGWIAIRFKSANTAEFQIIINVVKQNIFGTPEVNVTQLGGVAQSLTDLKDFADDGYDPATNKVQGVVLVDTTTTNADMRGTDGVDTAAMRGTNGVDTATMRGTDGANTVAPDNAGISGIQTDLDNATDGLGALKALIDIVNTDLSNGTDGLGALKTLIDTVNTDLSNSTDGLGALKALIDIVDTVVDAIKVATDQLAFTAGNVHSHTKVQDNIALTTQQKLDVNVEAKDILFTDTLAELGVAAPSATPTIAAAITLLSMALRNKLIVNGTDKEFHNDAGTKIYGKVLTLSGGIYTEAEAL